MHGHRLTLTRILDEQARQWCRTSSCCVRGIEPLWSFEEEVSIDIQIASPCAARVGQALLQHSTPSSLRLMALPCSPASVPLLQQPAFFYAINDLTHLTFLTSGFRVDQPHKRGPAGSGTRCSASTLQH